MSVVATLLWAAAGLAFAVVYNYFLGTLDHLIPEKKPVAHAEWPAAPVAQKEAMRQQLEAMYNSMTGPPLFPQISNLPGSIIRYSPRHVDLSICLVCDQPQEVCVDRSCKDLGL